MKQQKGITLVALVITIIVLLILAGVSLATVARGNIVENANAAVEHYTGAANDDVNIVKEVDDLLQDYFDKYLSGKN